MRTFIYFGLVSAAAWLIPLGAARADESSKSILDVHVPKYADVWVVGEKTKQLGTEREFGTPELSADRVYNYSIRARWIDGDGLVHDQTRLVPVQAGQRVRIDFLHPAPTWQRVVALEPARRAGPVTVPVPVPVERNSFYRELPENRVDRVISDKAAVIRVKVPPKARVFLSGEQTAMGGILREFVTRDLESGKHYTAEIVAKWKESGLDVTQSRKVDLHPGDRITVDFTAPPEKKPPE